MPNIWNRVGWKVTLQIPGKREVGYPRLPQLTQGRNTGNGSCINVGRNKTTIAWGEGVLSTDRGARIGAVGQLNILTDDQKHEG